MLTSQTQLKNEWSQHILWDGSNAKRIKESKRLELKNLNFGEDDALRQLSRGLSFGFVTCSVMRLMGGVQI